MRAPTEHEHEWVVEMALVDSEATALCTIPGCHATEARPLPADHLHDWAEDTAFGDVRRHFACTVPGCTARRDEPRGDWRRCAFCGLAFDLEHEGGDDEHRGGPLCGGCYQPCHCQHCDPDGATDAAIDAARDTTETGRPR